MNAGEAASFYEEVKSELEIYGHSPLHQILILFFALDKLSSPDTERVGHTFILDLLAFLFDILPSVQADGCPPDYFYTGKLALQRALSLTHGSFSAEEIYQSMQTIDYLEQTIWCYLGSPWGRDDCLRTAFSADEHDYTTSMELLEHYVSFLIQRDNSYAVRSERILEHWRNRIRLSPDSVVIPLLQQLPVQQIFSTIEQPGRLHKLHCHLKSLITNSPSDTIATVNLLHGKDSWQFQQTAQHALNAARNLCAIQYRSLSTQRYDILLSFEAMDNVYTGYSFQLPLSTLLFYLMLHPFDRRTHEYLSQSVVISGGMDHSGDTVGLGDEVITKKLRTVYFSPATHFAYPRSDDDAVQRILYELTSQYPNRTLRTLPARDLRDITGSKEVVTIHEIPFRIRTLRSIQRNATRISLTSLLIAVSAMIYIFYFVLDFDTNPAEVYYNRGDHRLYVRNKNGNPLWSKSITSSDKSSFHPYFNHQQHGVVVDIDGDGENEVILGNAGHAANISDYLICYNADQTVRWKTRIGSPVLTSENDYRSIMYATASMILDTVDAAERLFLSTLSDFYPSFLYTFDLHGNISNRYYHHGLLAQLTLVASDFAGERYLIACGYHNGFERPCLIVFSPDSVFGCSPEEETHRLIDPNHIKGSEIYYITFPRSILSYLYNSPGVSLCHVNDINEKQLLIGVQQFYASDPVYTGYIYIAFNRYFHATTMRTNDLFDNYYARALTEGKIYRPMDEEYRKEYLSGIRYWNGNEFQAEPTKILRE